MCGLEEDMGVRIEADFTAIDMSGYCACIIRSAQPASCVPGVRV